VPPNRKRLDQGTRPEGDSASLDQARELEVVHTVSAIARSELEVDGILRDALATVTAGTGAEAGEVWLLEPGDETLRLAALHGGTPAFRERDRLGVGEGLPGLALARRSELAVPDLTVEPAFVRRSVIDAGFVAFRVVPMRAPAGVTGALAVASRAPTIMAKDYGRLLSQVAGELAIAVDNHRLREELRGARDLLDRLSARDALARSVHDELIQSLFGIGLGLQAALDNPSQSLTGTIKEMQAIIAQARSLIMQMERNHGPVVDLGRHGVELVNGLCPDA
jgi:GAF domain-containing protein